MNKCIICKTEIENYICNNCINTDLEKLCDKIIIEYKTNRQDEEEFYNNKIEPNLLENIIIDLTKNINSPKKEYYIIKTLYLKYYSVSKIKREYLINNANICLESDIISDTDKNIINTLLLDAYYKNYEFNKSETIANILINKNNLDEKTLYALGDYYIITRRYNQARECLNKALSICKNEKIKTTINNKIEECNARELGKENGGKAPYLPATYENKMIYKEFLNSINISIELQRQKAPQPDKIYEDDYPQPIEIETPNFNSFVAFDIETTGTNHTRDSITEIAAIKVKDGKIIESKEFIFQELVHPYKKRIPQEVEILTGITNEMVKDKREIWEVFKDFVDFIGDDILIGYNCMKFDSKFLVRAGRLSSIKIYNQYFDVMKYVSKLKYKLNYDNKTLTSIGELLGIKNENAHRALSDAITTAKIYLKLLELDKNDNNNLF